MEAGSGLPHGLRPFHGRLIRVMANPEGVRNIPHPQPPLHLQAEPPDLAVRRPALLLVRVHPLEAPHLRNLDELFAVSDHGTPFAGSVRGIGSRDSRSRRRRASPTLLPLP